MCVVLLWYSGTLAASAAGTVANADAAANAD